MVQKDKKQIVFNTFQEYQDYYTVVKKDKTDKSKNRYYQIGVDIAKMACQRVGNEITDSSVDIS